MSLSLLSAVLAVLSFPGFNQGWLAWIYLVPLLYAGLKESKLRSFLSACFCVEFVKWFWIVIWLRHVSWLGLIGIAVAMASYQLIWFFCFWKTKQIYLHRSGVPFFGLLIWLVLVWVGMEWVRCNPFSVPGATLSVTQWLYPSVLTVCAFGGGYLLSGLVLLNNLAVVSLCIGFYRKDLKRQFVQSTFISLSVVVYILGANGLIQVLYPRDSKESVSVKVAVVQPDQPPYRFWNSERQLQAMNVIFGLSRSVSTEDFDLMVWPEGALPYPVSKGNSIDQEVEFLIKHWVKRPLLWGNQGIVEGKHINGVFLTDQNGELSDTYYAKRFLVPFGEFIPFRSVLSFLDTIVPIGSGFTRGEEAVNYSVVLNDRRVNICPLVCYEDCFPQLAVDNAKLNADLIFVATYNGWYGQENGAYMHAAHSVIRAAETRLPVLRCGSNGWSGLIDGTGRIRHTLLSENESSIYYRGIGIIEFDIPLGQKRSVYTQLPEWLGGLFAGAVLIGIYWFLFPNRSHKRKL